MTAADDLHVMVCVVGVWAGDWLCVRRWLGWGRGLAAARISKRFGCEYVCVTDWLWVCDGVDGCGGGFLGVVVQAAMVVYWEWIFGCI